MAIQRTRTTRTCRYRADQDCLQPMLTCKACPHYLPSAPVELKKRTPAEKIGENLPEIMPYVKLEGPLREPAIEIGIKGTF